MVTLLDTRAAHSGEYSSYREPDTRVPPRARPVLNAISVNGVAIAESDILAEAQNHPAGSPGAALLAAARALVVRALLVQRAAVLGIEVGGGLESGGETIEEAAVRLLVEREVKVPAATREECRRFYDRNPGKFQGEAIFEASHILIAAASRDRAARDEARKRAQSLAAQLADDPTTFAALANAHSACPSGRHGGNLGQITRGSTVPEFERALGELDEGAITTAPVESRFGFHIMRLDRKIDGSPLPFEAVSDRIADWLEASAWSKAVSQYIAILAADAEIAGIDLLGGEAQPLS
jgi:peptidyl-prolyl cis-trans isomerase C